MPEDEVRPEYVPLLKALNGKLVYWVLSVLLATTGTLSGILWRDIRADVKDIKSQTSGLDVLDLRVQRLEIFHIPQQPGGE